MRTFRRIALLSCLAMMMGAPAAARAAEGWGINPAQLMLNSNDPLSLQRLRALRASGITVVRQEYQWTWAQPSRPGPAGPTFEWGPSDRMMRLITEAGLRWYATLDYFPAWANARNDFLFPPDDPSLYGTYTRAFAERYGPGGEFWREYPHLPRNPPVRYELGNEPNVQFFFRDQAHAPVRYAQLAASGMAGARAADPVTPVAVGGLAGGHRRASTLPFLAELRRQLPGRPDYVSYHPYNPRPRQVLADVRAFMRAVDRTWPVRHGRRVRVDLSEWGFARSSRKASFLATTARALRRVCGLGYLNAYVWQDPSTGGAFDLFHKDGRPTSAGQAYARQTGRRRCDR